ncbi:MULTISPECIES: OmpA family protein [unclassified Flavobacterium]|uniref:OmpA family protein n=1 Tax=unclassified Flavobacterium TaxID=196869 RepID=UPI003F91E024
MKKNILLCLTMISVFSFNTYSQEAKMASANKKYDNFAYIDAIQTYERVAEKGYKSTELFQKLGNAYYFNAQLENAAKWYKELFALGGNVAPEYYYRYAQSLRASGENDKADEIQEKFNQIASNDDRAKLFIKNQDYLEGIKANSSRYQIEDAGINSPYSDYGTTVSNNKLIFTSARDTGSVSQRKHTWTNEHFTSLYSADLDADMNPKSSVQFDKNLKSKFNESTPVFTKDGKTVFFTRNNYIKGKKGKNSRGTTLIKIYKATLVNNEWTNVTELPFNSNNYSTAHPALSPDEKTLYFASDMPGTFGQSDLFKVAINNNGIFGKPENLGTVINTAGRETFPFVNTDNEIYFASDGHPGMGGLDVFVAKLNAAGTFDRVQNIGAGINSPKDDFAYWIDTTSRNGFFTSNRDGGQGFDDIYKFKELKKITCEQMLYGNVTDMETSEILPNSKIRLFDKDFKLLESVITDEKGNYSFTVICGKDYRIRAERNDYVTIEVLVTIDQESGKTDLPIALEPIKKKVKVGDDLAKFLEIPLIYFDLDKSNIRRDAALELEKVLDVLTQNKTMKIDIRSHTDSRQTKKYNEALSERRAKSTMNWLIENGIDSSRLTSKGYGETQLINHCSDGVNCSEEEHQLNRRSEFIITSL